MSIFYNAFNSLTPQEKHTEIAEAVEKMNSILRVAEEQSQRIATPKQNEVLRLEAERIIELTSP